MDVNVIARQFNEDGCGVVRGLFSLDEIQVMETHLDEFIRDVVPGLAAGDVYFEDAPEGSSLRPIKSIFRLEEHSQFFRRLMTDNRLINIACAIFPDAEIKPIGAFFFGKPAHSGSVTPPHQDNAFQNLVPPEAVVATISIDEATPLNGVLTCQRGSHRIGVLPHRPSGIMGFSQTLIEPLDTNLYPEVQLCMKPGDVALHHTNVVHRSDGNTTDRSRRQLGIQYYSSRAQRDVAAWERYQQEVRKLHAQQATT
jgi:hypothetical protein